MKRRNILALMLIVLALSYAVYKAAERVIVAAAPALQPGDRK